MIQIEILSIQKYNIKKNSKVIYGSGVDIDFFVKEKKQRAKNRN